MTGPLRDLGGALNLNVLLPDGFVARVYRSWTSPARLDAIQSVREHLAARGLPTTELVRTSDGAAWVRLGDRLVEVERFLDGEDMDTWEGRRVDSPHRGGRLAVGSDARKPSAVQAPVEARHGYGVRQAEPGCSARYPELDPQAGWAEGLKETHVRYMVVVERGESSWGAHVPDLPGCIAVGETRDEALSLIRAAIEFHIEGLVAEGSPVPEPRSEGDVVDVGAA